MTIDDLDRRIIAVLRSEGQLPSTDLACRFEVSEATVRRRIRKLVEKDVLHFAALVNPQKSGLHIDVLLGIKVDRPYLWDAAQGLASLQETRYVGISTGAYDIIAAALFGSQEELLEFLTNTLSEIPGIRSTDTWHILKIVKRTYDWVTYPSTPSPETNSHRREG